MKFWEETRKKNVKIQPEDTQAEIASSILGCNPSPYDIFFSLNFCGSPIDKKEEGKVN